MLLFLLPPFVVMGQMQFIPSPPCSFQPNLKFTKIKCRRNSVAPKSLQKGDGVTKRKESPVCQAEMYALVLTGKPPGASKPR